jgi:hypothetical protein
MREPTGTFAAGLGPNTARAVLGRMAARERLPVNVSAARAAGADLVLDKCLDFLELQGGCREADRGRYRPRRHK